jgi:hypothetical protein
VHQVHAPKEVSQVVTKDDTVETVVEKVAATKKSKKNTTPAATDGGAES